MSLEPIPTRIALGVAVWIGAYFAMRRMLGGVVTQRAGLLAFGLAAPLGLAATLAWQADPWYRYSVVTLCAAFIALYVAIVGLEKGQRVLS